MILIFTATVNLAKARLKDTKMKNASKSRSTSKRKKSSTENIHILSNMNLIQSV